MRALITRQVESRDIANAYPVPTEVMAQTLSKDSVFYFLCVDHNYFYDIISV